MTRLTATFGKHEIDENIAGGEPALRANPVVNPNSFSVHASVFVSDFLRQHTERKTINE